MQLTVIFRNVAPSEDLIELARRLLGRLPTARFEDGGTHLCIERLQGRDDVAYKVAASAHAGQQACVEVERDPFQAVRQAIARLERQALIGLPFEIEDLGLFEEPLGARSPAFKALGNAPS